MFFWCEYNGLISFSTFSDSIHPTNILKLGILSSNIEFIYSSLINNHNYENGLILEGITKIDQSIFYNNSRILFEFLNGNHQITNSYIFHPGTLLKNQTLITFVFALNGFNVDFDYTYPYSSSFKCQTANDTFEIIKYTPSITTPIQSSHPTPFDTIKMSPPMCVQSLSS